MATIRSMVEGYHVRRRLSALGLGETSWLQLFAPVSVNAKSELRLLSGDVDRPQDFRDSRALLCLCGNNLQPLDRRVPTVGDTEEALLSRIPDGDLDRDVEGVGWSVTGLCEAGRGQAPPLQTLGRVGIDGVRASPRWTLG